MNFIKQPKGLSFEFGLFKKFRPRIYIGELKQFQIRPSFIHSNGKLEICTYGGIKFDILYGTMRRPIPKFWIPYFWVGGGPESKYYLKNRQLTNPWNSGNHWFVLTLKRMVGLFILICIGNKTTQPGFYIGTKTYKVDKISSQKKDYSKENPLGTDQPECWLYNKNGFPIYTWATQREQGNEYLCLSASIRKDMLDE